MIIMFVIKNPMNRRSRWKTSAVENLSLVPILMSYFKNYILTAVGLTLVKIVFMQISYRAIFKIGMKIADQIIKSIGINPFAVLKPIANIRWRQQRLSERIFILLFTRSLKKSLLLLVCLESSIIGWIIMRLCFGFLLVWSNKNSFKVSYV